MDSNPTIRIAINGFGRIGRCLVRALSEHPARERFELVAINDLADFNVLAHLLAFDTTHGRWPYPVHYDGQTMEINGLSVPCYAIADLEKLPWRELAPDLVFECSGRYKQRAQLQQHLDAGARRVLASYPVGDADAMVVYGVNHKILDDNQRIVSNASCTTNCLAPLVDVLDRNFTVKQGLMTTIHSYTNDQNLVDKAHGDLLRARAAAVNMIPTRTGAAQAVGKVLPHLAGRLDGMAVRVPTLNVSLVDLTLLLEQPATVEAIHDSLNNAAHGDLQGVLAMNHLALVSSDFNHQPYSCVVDTNHTRILEQQLKVLVWYDNEWGFSHRMLDVAAYWMER
ncbi:glyceraldehyde-3-phosphate dehydrogenase [Alcanivorax sp. 97CO-5]|jgi:glyceraldehyde 3-phosphate dehydrogenase|uniref:type I glyceraldehyde-3-phosphate dehydrogenase n=1 Tax=unclassified Alcanivorax TaxID=2638842 RepID=UPI0003E7F18C|nr:MULTISPECIES: type I glyceraldehyde-3-phosphate dehydrogenase [unclassified Alcanivorax]EUC69451.1 glyceraldehyde-3-phosphate dehydrogenase [Alcanivorax sp. 97CO-5]PKG01366.1 type I glyceraldehyde-3-phosphate dehydrogenase [Alcanivorax sp. 97CO-6]